MNETIETSKKKEKRDATTRTLYSGRNTDGMDDIEATVVLCNTDSTPGGYSYSSP